MQDDGSSYYHNTSTVSDSLQDYHECLEQVMCHGLISSGADPGLGRGRLGGWGGGGGGELEEWG